MSYKQPYIHAVDYLPLTSGTGVAYTDFEFKISSDNNYEFLKMIHQATSNSINVKWYNSTTGRYYFQPHADIRGVSGTAFSGITPNGFIPGIFTMPITVSAGTELVMSAADNSGSSNTVRIALHGNYIYDGVAPWEGLRRENWSIPVNFGAVGANQSATKTVVLENKAGLLVNKITGFRTGSCLIYIMSDGMPWMSRAIHFDNLCGNGQFGDMLPSTKWVKPGSSITINIMDLSGSSNTVGIVLTGERVYVA